jgi:hypothetical protein
MLLPLDISRCDGRGCELKENCLRFLDREPDYGDRYCYLDSPWTSPNHCPYQIKPKEEGQG